MQIMVGHLQRVMRTIAAQSILRDSLYRAYQAHLSLREPAVVLYNKHGRLGSNFAPLGAIGGILEWFQSDSRIGTKNIRA